MKILWAHLTLTAPKGFSDYPYVRVIEGFSDFPLSSAPRVSDSVSLGVCPDNLYFFQVPSWCCWSWDPTWRTITLFPVFTTGSPLSRSSIQFSHLVVPDSLLPHGLQHARLPYPSSTPRSYSNSCLSSWWCHPTVSSSVIPFSSCFQSFPASGSFPMSQLFAWGGRSIGVSASASVLPMNIQDWFPLGWVGGISSQSKRLSRVFSSTTVQKHQFFGTQLSLLSNSYIHTWPLEKP